MKSAEKIALSMDLSPEINFGNFIFCFYRDFYSLPILNNRPDFFLFTVLKMTFLAW